jgi:phosphoenolpyruvate carboxykinase (GTP)
MLERNKGKDIVTEIGGIHSVEAALDLLKSKMDAEQFSKIEKIHNPDVLKKIGNAVAMCDPDTIFVNTGSDEDRQFARDLALKQGEEKPLAMPNHTIHYDLKDEQGRIVDRTFYIVNEGEAASSLGKKMLRADAMEDVRDKMGGVMKGRTMLIGFFIRGPAGSPVSNPALEITSSAYVMHSANILYRNAYAQFDDEVENRGHFYANIHSEGPNRAEDLANARVFMDRSMWTTYSVFCTYAGNTLLLKKGNHRFTVAPASRGPAGGRPGSAAPPRAAVARPPPRWPVTSSSVTTWPRCGSPTTAASVPSTPSAASSASWPTSTGTAIPT